MNYKWFSSRYSNFAYIDRIAIDESSKKKGIGSGLYTDLESTMKDKYDLIACEFNIKPLNESSKKFHENLDYKNVGYQYTENSTNKFP